MAKRPRTWLRNGALTALIALQVAGCVPPPKPAPAPNPAPAPAPPPPPPPPAPAPAPANWRDAPQTPGDWRYVPAVTGGTATYGEVGAPVLTLHCDLAARIVEITRTSAAAGPMTVRAENADEVVFNLAAEALPAGPRARVTANSPVLDAIAYSRGTFSVESSGAPTVYVPGWPEVARVIEDCR